MRDTAEMHISELEQQLKSTSRQLEQEKLQARNSKEEHRKRVEGLQVENAQIQAELEQVYMRAGICKVTCHRLAQRNAILT